MTLSESDISLENIELLSSENVAMLVKGIDIYKSSGFSEISSRLLKDGFSVLTEQLKFVMNLSLITGIFPDEWKIATVTPIPKGGVLSNVNNIRPISLTPLPGKLLERYIHSKFVPFLEDNKLLYNNQGGFRKNKSTTLTVFHLVNEIALAKNNDKFSLAVYLDLAKAFDTINHNLLLQKLDKIGIRGMCWKWLLSYMSNRKQVVVNGGHRSSEHTVVCGVPQGSILGPLLFIIYMNDMTKLSLTGKLLLFADDAVLFHSDTCVNTLYSNVQKDLDSVLNWCSFNKLCINSNKTKATFFDNSFSRSSVSNHHLYIRGEEIARVDHCEYLGIAVDDRLSFKKQISKCSIRVNNRLFQLRKIRGCITTNCALSIYKTMILPLLEYGGVFLSSCTDAEQTKLQRLQNAALRTVYRQDNYARVYDLHIRANLLPLKLRREITLIKIMHTKVYNNEGICVRNLNTRNYDGPVMDICRPNSNRFSKSVAYRGPVSWNQLKPDLRCINDKYVFVKAIKSYFWELYMSHQVV